MGNKRFVLGRDSKYFSIIYFAKVAQEERGASP